MRALDEATRPARIFAHSPHDAVLVALSIAHAGLIVAAPSFVVIGLALWWNANTVSHNFIHLPFFTSRVANRAYTLYLSLLLGFPQSLWRDRHLAHHERQPNPPLGRETLLEGALIAVLWLTLLNTAPSFFFGIYLPGIATGLALCFVHGRFEHMPHTRSHYGAVYNAVFFNDGYHVEHHAGPGRHWTQLPSLGAREISSALPAVLRWLALFNLETLERQALRSRWLTRCVLRAHERAIAALKPAIGPVEHITIVGGALFPRTALICNELFPDARVRIVDANARNIEVARQLLDDARIEFVCARFTPGQAIEGTDLAIVPLSLQGGRDAVYASPPARYTLVHDWLHHRGRCTASAIVAFWLFKRINLIERP